MEAAVSLRSAWFSGWRCVPVIGLYTRSDPEVSPRASPPRVKKVLAEALAHL